MHVCKLCAYFPTSYTHLGIFSCFFLSAETVHKKRCCLQQARFKKRVGTSMVKLLYLILEHFHEREQQLAPGMEGSAPQAPLYTHSTSRKDLVKLSLGQEEFSLSHLVSVECLFVSSPFRRCILKNLSWEMGGRKKENTISTLHREPGTA